MVNSQQHTRATLGEQTFPTFTYKKGQTVYMKNKKLTRAKIACIVGRIFVPDMQARLKEDYPFVTVAWVTLSTGPTFIHINTLSTLRVEATLFHDLNFPVNPKVTTCE